MIIPKDSDLPMVVTQDKEAKAVIQDVTSYEQKLGVPTLLKILILGQQQVETNQLTSVEEIVQRLKSKNKKD